MRGVFDDDEELERPKHRRDTELTLNAGTLLLIFFGLVLVCGFFFGLGYVAGRRVTQPPSAASQQSPAGVSPTLQANDSLPKPSATSEPATPPAQGATPDNPQTAAGSLPQPAAPAAPPAVQKSAPASLPGQPQVRPALPLTSSAPQPPATSNPGSQAPSATQLMVQIAAVSHVEDADVLVGALRRRGYAVNVIRDPADNLIHVRVGPFSTRDEANRWRLKLLNDGYNAMIQP